MNRPDAIIAVDLKELKLLNILCHRELSQSQLDRLMGDEIDDGYWQVIYECIELITNDNSEFARRVLNCMKDKRYAKVLMLTTAQVLFLSIQVQAFVQECEGENIPAYILKLKDKLGRCLEG